MANNANVWNPQTIIATSADTKRIEQGFTATNGQLLFTLTSFAYAVGTGALEVFYENAEGHLIYLEEGIDWTEGTSATFSLLVPAILNRRLVAVGYVGITANVDVRDTDIFVSNYQGLRDYAGTETTLYAQGQTTTGDGGEHFFAKVTGAAPAFYVDDNYKTIVPTGGDGSAAWICNKVPVDYNNIAELIASKRILNGDTVVVREGVAGNGGGAAKWDVVLSSTVTENGVNIIQCTGVPTLSIVYQVDGMVNARALGIISDLGVTEQRTQIQAVVDQFPLNDVFLPSGVYKITPTSNINGVTVPATSATSLYGEGGTIFYGDNALGPLVNYRATGNTVAGTITDTNRVGTRGVFNIAFKSTWNYVLDATLDGVATALNPGGVYTSVYDVNDVSLFFDFKIGEGTCLAIGNDGVRVDGCSFYNTPAGILFETATTAGRVFGGVSYPHVFGGYLTNYSFRTCMYGIVCYSDYNLGNYVGALHIGDGWVQDIYKAAIATVGPVVTSTITNTIWSNQIFLCALLEAPNEIVFGQGHYEIGFSKKALELFKVATTLNFNDLSADAAYTSVPVHTATVYEYFGYLDNGNAVDRNAIIEFEHFNRPLYINRDVLVIADVYDETSNYTTESAVDASFTGSESGIHVRKYNSNKSTGGVAIFNVDVAPPFTVEEGQMFRTASYVNKSNKHINLARAPLCFGGNTTGRDPDSFVADGGKPSQEYVLLADDLSTSAHIIRFAYDIGYTATAANMFVLYSAAIAVVSTSDGQPAVMSFDCANKCSTAGIVPNDGVFRTYSIMTEGEDATEFAVINSVNNDVTFRITDMQAIAFSSLTDLHSFMTNRIFATGRAASDPTQSFIIDITPTEEGAVITTEYEWLAGDTTSRNVYSVDNFGEVAGPYFELERLETRLITGTGAALTIDDDTTVGYWVASFTPAGTDWVTQTIANARPTSSANTDLTMIMNPVGATTMKLQVRAKYRYL